MVRTTGSSDQSISLFKQGGIMLSIQGLTIMFLFGILVAMAVMSFWLMYHEWKLERADRLAKEEWEAEIRKKIQKKFFEEGDDEGPL
jgi:Na+-transporting methylmalonyl-CoA/oxaloacetate decarboxylase gamma subunit